MHLRRNAFSLLVAVSFWATGALCQTSPNAAPEPQPPSASQTTQNTGAPIPIGGGVVIPAQLSKSVDAKKAKPGDKVEAKTTMDLLSHGQVVIPRDTKVIGHVTEAKPHSKESPESSVGLSFDRISLKDGRELPMRSSVQAIGRSLNSFASPGADTAGAAPSGMPSTGAPDSRGGMGGSSGGSSRPSGSSGSYPSSTPQQMPSGASPAGESAGPVLDAHSQGVIGIKGLQLTSSGQTSVVSSENNNVHLDSGTQLVLRTE
jgi:hypothetical protein